MPLVVFKNMVFEPEANHIELKLTIAPVEDPTAEDNGIAEWLIA